MEPPLSWNKFPFSCASVSSFATPEGFSILRRKDVADRRTQTAAWKHRVTANSSAGRMNEWFGPDTYSWKERGRFKYTKKIQTTFHESPWIQNGEREGWLLTQGFWVLWTNSTVTLINITQAKQGGFLRIDLSTEPGNHSALLPKMWPHHWCCCALNTQEGNLQWCEGTQSLSQCPRALRREQECCRLQFATAAQLL